MSKPVESINGQFRPYKSNGEGDKLRDTIRGHYDVCYYERDNIHE
jgi:hypothetical protein